MMLLGLSFRQVSDNFYVANNTDTFTYSDGAKDESHLLDIVRTAKNLSTTSWELNDTAKTWVDRYHFSVHRGAIVRCLSFASSQRVLELGAGCGAITRALGERFHHVDAIEGSPRRARICAMRCEGLQNVQVFAADIDKISPAPEYDLVFLIGVLEWSQGFLTGAHPFHRCLQIASKALKDDGVLVIAIENQLGLKYFLGSGEDHCGVPMEGLHGYPSVAKAKTFSRLGLSGLLKDAGFPVSRFLYPFPDYKLAKVVLTDEAVALNSESIAYWISRYDFEDYQKPASYIYGNQSLIANEVARAGLLAELSNSFLVIAGKKNLTIDGPPWLVWSERLTRNMALSSTTTLERLDDKLVVKKTYPYFPSEQPPDSISGFGLNRLPTQSFLDGSGVEMELLRCAVSGNASGFIRIVVEWLNYVAAHFRTDDDSSMRADAWDCIPRNLIRLPSGELEVFDLEFVKQRPFKIEELCGRGLYCWFCDHARWANKIHPEAQTAREVILWIMSKIFTSADTESILFAVLEAETKFQRWVNPGEQQDAYALIELPMRGGDVHDYIAERLREKESELARLKEHADRLQMFSDAVRQTWVYRTYRNFIKPLRSS
jgi:SAM-dependent methyltransferase